MVKKLGCAFFLLFLLAWASPAFSDTVIGLPAASGSGNCFPFGCAYNGDYQQVYSASQFSGPLTITDLEFFNTQDDGGATAMNSGTWTISLSTTAADWNTLSTTFSSNLGGDNTEVFTGDLSQPWSFGDTLSIDLSTPFTYDPSTGNLLMTVNVNGSTAAGGNIFFDVNNGNTFLGRVYCSSGDCTNSVGVDPGHGLVTGFSTATPVPEPSTFLLLEAGLLGLVGFAAVRRRYPVG